MTSPGADGGAGPGRTVKQLPDGWHEPLLSHWFQTLTRTDWFSKNDTVDRVLGDKFADLHARLAASAGSLIAPNASARELLAAAIVLDQIPRNIYRNTPRMFASDGVARMLAALAIDEGKDKRLSANERLFLYLPFEHSENLADQERSVALMSSLGDDEYTRFAIAHREIIARFGRFPHRNAVLGRTSTPEETAFLSTPGSSF